MGQRVEVMERGHVYFFYRPKVQNEDPSGLEDIQRTYMVLKVSGNEPRVVRVLVLGRKQLPDPGHRGRPFWGFVETVTRDPQDLHATLASEDYETSTRGMRHRPGARAAGEGHYVLLRHGGEESGGAKGSGRRGRAHTHLAYRLQQPLSEGGQPPAGSPQAEMNIAPQASFILQVKNPEASAQAAKEHHRGTPVKRTEPFPRELQQQLGSLRFAPCDPPAFLDHQGCEFLLIAAKDDVAAELGADVAEDVGEPCQELEGGDDSVLGLLEDSRKDHGELVLPLFEATWS